MTMSTAVSPQLLLDKCHHALSRLIVVGSDYDGLFPSVLHPSSGVPASILPDPIPGQRMGDRAFPGANLIHDTASLECMYALATAREDGRLRAAADAYLRHFATHCTNTETGLFPWGEHSFWHFTEQRSGNSYHLASHSGQVIHDHLRQAPVWLWRKLDTFKPGCVSRFAEALDGHWSDDARTRYCRHAHVETWQRFRTSSGRSCDFPRHSGFYILDWAFAYSRTRNSEFLAQIQRMLDYWWPLRDERGLLLIESECPEGDRFHQTNAPAQTLSLAASLFDAAALLNVIEPEVAAIMRERAAVYIDGFFAAPHDLEEGIYVILSKRSDNSVVETMPVWGSRYGVWPASYAATFALCAYRYCKDERLLEFATSVGDGYRELAFPSDVQVPAMDAGLGLELLADLFDITRDEGWLDGGLELAETLMPIYFDAILPRGAAGYDWYDSQMGPGFLLHGLMRLGLLAEEPDACPLAPNYTAR